MISGSGNDSPDSPGGEEREQSPWALHVGTSPPPSTVSASFDSDENGEGSNRQDEQQNATFAGSSTGAQPSVDEDLATTPLPETLVIGAVDDDVSWGGIDADRKLEKNEVEARHGEIEPDLSVEPGKLRSSMPVVPARKPQETSEAGAANFSTSITAPSLTDVDLTGGQGNAPFFTEDDVPGDAPGDAGDDRDTAQQSAQDADKKPKKERRKRRFSRRSSRSTESAAPAVADTAAPLASAMAGMDTLAADSSADGTEEQYVNTPESLGDATVREVHTKPASPFSQLTVEEKAEETADAQGADLHDMDAQDVSAHDMDARDVDAHDMDAQDVNVPKAVSTAEQGKRIFSRTRRRRRVSPDRAADSDASEEKAPVLVGAEVVEETSLAPVTAKVEQTLPATEADPAAVSGRKKIEIVTNFDETIYEKYRISFFVMGLAFLLVIFFRWGPFGPESDDAPVLVQAPSILVGASPLGMTAGDDSLWIAHFESGALIEVDPVGNILLDSVTVGPGLQDVTFGAGSLWATSSSRGTLSRIDPSNKKILAVIPVGTQPGAVTFAAGSVWVANFSGGNLARVDPATNTVVASIPVGKGPRDVVFGAGSVWVANYSDGTVMRVDPVANAVSSIIPVVDLKKDGELLTSLAFGDGAVWVARFGDPGKVSRIDPAMNKVVSTITTGRGTWGLTFGGDNLWVTNLSESVLLRLDSDTNTVTGRKQVGIGPWDVIVLEGYVWVTNAGGGTLARVHLDQMPEVAPAGEK